MQASLFDETRAVANGPVAGPIIEPANFILFFNFLTLFIKFLWPGFFSILFLIKVDALGSITSSCTVFRSTPDDAKDVDRAQYGDEGKKSRHFVSNEQIPLHAGEDHIGRTTAETREQLELKSAAHVASATKVNN